MFRTAEGAKTADDFQLDLDWPHQAFGQVIVERDLEITQTPQQMGCRFLFLSAISPRCPALFGEDHQASGDPVKASAACPIHF
ncbi:MAG: hypothetical protein ACR2HF_10580 [Methylococcaceae bacterium]